MKPDDEKQSVDPSIDPGTVARQPSLVERYRIALASSATVSLEELTAQSKVSQRELVELCELELSHLARKHSIPSLDSYVARFALWPAPEDLPADLIKHHFLLRQEANQHPRLSDYQSRFPDQVSSLAPDTAAEDKTLTIELQPGTVVGDYRIEELLGSGAFARVYRAHQNSLNRTVALKVSQGNPGEGRRAARLEHDAIIPIYAESEYLGLQMLAMRFVPGITLLEFLNRLETHPSCDRNRADENQLMKLVVPDEQWQPTSRPETRSRNFAGLTCQWLSEVARGIHHAHQNGIIHRDVKPSNILISYRSKAYLLDFNVSTDSDSDHQDMAGTYAYMSPEQLSPVSDTKAPIDHRSDIYSLGVVLYECLSGVSFTASKDPSHIHAERISETVRHQIDTNSVWPRALKLILAKSIALRCEDRYQTAEQLADDLQSFAESLKHTQQTVFATAWDRLDRVVGLKVAILLLIVAFVFVWAVPQWQETQAQNHYQTGLDILYKAGQSGGGHAAAIEPLERAREYGLDSAELHRDLGFALFYAERFSEAVEQLTIVIDRGYESSELFLFRGTALGHTGDYDRARRDLGRAIELDPASDAARNNLQAILELEQLQSRQ